jgi:DNA invertase Pin-like site-specific DNA recombinase
MGRKPKLSREKIEIAQKLIDSGQPPKKVAAALDVTYPTLSRALATAQPN